MGPRTGFDKCLLLQSSGAKSSSIFHRRGCASVQLESEPEGQGNGVCHHAHAIETGHHVATLAWWARRGEMALARGHIVSICILCL